jgi:uncharacterized integral membrane protein
VKLLYWLIVAVVAVVLIVFTLDNFEPVRVDFSPLPLAVDTRLYLVVLLALLIGFLAGEVVAWIGGRRWRREARQRAQRIAALERELVATQAQLKSGAASRPVAPVDPSL